MTAPNRHVITFTCCHPSTNNGMPFRAQAPQTIVGTLATAQQILAAKIADHAADAHKFAGVCSEFGLHSWHQAPTPAWGPPPMSAPGCDAAWRDMVMRSS